MNKNRYLRLVLGWLWLALFFVPPLAVNAQQSAAIASAHPLATEAGYDILKRGGKLTAMAVDQILNDANASFDALRKRVNR